MMSGRLRYVDRLIQAGAKATVATKDDIKRLKRNIELLVVQIWRFFPSDSHH